MGLLLQCFVNSNSQSFPVRWFSLKPFPATIRTATFLRIVNYRQLMLGTYKVTESSDSFTGTKEISKFTLAVQRGRVPYNMIVNMSFVRMGANDEGVSSLEKASCKIISDLICFLWRNLSWLKGLSYLIGDYIILFFFACKMFVLPF